MKQEDTSSEAGPPMELDVQRLLQTPQFSRSLLASLIAFPGLQQHSESPGSLLAMPQVEPSPTTGIHSMNPPLFHRAAQGAQPQQPPPAPPPQPAATEGGRRQQQPAPTTVQLRDSDKPQVSHKQPTGKQSVANSDGWQWRKYGEKVVKGSPNPRSYYKCSHASCPAKKIVERNEAGDVLSTDYKGEHCHPAPNSAKASRFKPPKPRGAAPAQEAQASSSTAGMAAVAATTQATLDPRLNLLSVPGLGQLGLLGFPAMSMLSLPDALRGLHSPYEEPPQHDDDDDTDDTNEQTGATQPKSAGKDEVSKRTRDGSHSARKEFRKDEGSPVNSKRLDALAEAAEKELFSNSPESVPSSKRQHTEAPNSTAKSTRAADDDAEGDDDGDMREGGRQRVIHVDSETYADGYKWRKYGQKQVKGSPYPRSYYKCTHPNCPVRKHVERSADHSDKWTVTYEGQHSHPAPNQTARKSPKSPEGAAEPEPQKQQQQAAEAIKDDSSQPSSPQRPTSFSRAQSRGVPAMPALTTQYQTLLQAQQLAFMHASLAQASLAHIPLLPGFTAEGLAQAAGARSLAEGSQATPDAAAAVASPLANLAAANLSLFASQLMRQLTPLDFAVLGAASAQASGSASGSAGWDPLACLITPRSTASPSVPPPSSRGGQKRSRQDDAAAAARGGSEQATTASGAAAGGKQRQQGLRWLKSTVEPMEEDDDGDGEEGNEDGEAAASGEEEENEDAAAAGEEEEDVKPAVMKASVKVKDEPLQAHGGEPQQKVGGRRANSKYAKVKEEQQVRAAGAVEEAAGEQGGSSEKPPAERGTRAAGGGTKVTVKAELQ